MRLRVAMVTSFYRNVQPGRDIAKIATRILTPAANLCVGISSILDRTQISASEIEDRVVAANFFLSAGKVTQVPSHDFPIG